MLGAERAFYWLYSLLSLPDAIKQCSRHLSIFPSPGETTPCFLALHDKHLIVVKLWSTIPIRVSGDASIKSTRHLFFLFYIGRVGQRLYSLKFRIKSRLSLDKAHFKGLAKVKEFTMWIFLFRSCGLHCASWSSQADKFIPVPRNTMKISH